MLHLRVAFLTILIGCQATESQSSDDATRVHELSDLEIDEFVAKGRHFILFHDPNDPKCSNFAPIYNEVAQQFDDATIKFSRLDCTQFRSTCYEHRISGKPAIKFVVDGAINTYYHGDFSFEHFHNFTIKKLNQDIEAVELLNSNELIKLLDDETFDDAIGSGFTFVKFFAPWCPKSKRWAPVLHEVAIQSAAISDAISIAKVNCDDCIELCQEEGVLRTPTLVMYKNGFKLSKYSGERKIEEVMKAIRLYAPAHQNVKSEL